jgi:hypothetical protein
MYHSHEALARAHMSELLDEARAQRRGQRFAVAKRRARKAERAAVRARLSLLRSL